MRQNAIKWWESLNFLEKWENVVKNKTLITGYPHRPVDTLTGFEIEEMWKNRNM